MGILLILKILGIILDVQGYIGNFGYLRVFWSSIGYSSSFRGIWVILG